MNVVEAALRRAADDLSALGVHWAVVGGFAVSARAEPRFTRDVDLAVAVSDDRAAESVTQKLMNRGYALLSTVEHDVTGRLSTVRLASPVPGGVVVDVLFASSGIEAETAEGADILQVLPGLSLPVASVAHLLVMKVLARDDTTRPQDSADLSALRAVVTPHDLDVALAVARLVKQRGYHRDRDLEADIRDILGS